MIDKTKDPITFATAATRNLYPALGPWCWRILSLYPDAKIYLMVDDDSDKLILPKLLQCSNIQYINLHKIGIDPNGANYNSSFTYGSLARLYLPRLLKEDKVLYMDMDTLLIDKIDEIWYEDMGNTIYMV